MRLHVTSSKASIMAEVRRAAQVAGPETAAGD